MPDFHAPRSSSLDRCIGRALLAERRDEGVVAIEDGRVAACTRAAAELLAWDAEAALGAPAAELIDSVADEVLRLRLASALREDAGVEFVAPRPERPDGWLTVRSLPLRPGVLFLLRDVTESEQSDRALRRKEHRLLAANRSLRLAHVAARAASWEWRAGRSLRWLDLAAARDLDCLPPAWTEQEEIPEWRSIVSSGDRRALDRVVAALASRGQASLEVEVVGADEARHWMRIDSAVTERDANGAPLRVSGVTVDVTAARRADAALREEIAERKRSEERQQLLLNELNHRVKNMLATVQSIARQSLAPLDGRSAREFEERLMALTWAYEIITREHWAGASLREVIERTMAPHVGRASRRLALDGPELWLTPNRALAVGLAMHELATNAVKYGAFSNDRGVVAVSWRLRADGGPAKLELDWTESGGPPVEPPRRRGFGSRLIEHSLARDLGGEVTLLFEPPGLRCRVLAPLDEGVDR
jgi:two-component sensor histidine kinase